MVTTLKGLGDVIRKQAGTSGSQGTLAPAAPPVSASDDFPWGELWMATVEFLAGSQLTSLPLIEVTLHGGIGFQTLIKHNDGSVTLKFARGHQYAFGLDSQNRLTYKVPDGGYTDYTAAGLHLFLDRYQYNALQRKGRLIDYPLHPVSDQKDNVKSNRLPQALSVNKADFMVDLRYLMNWCKDSDLVNGFHNAMSKVVTWR